VFGNYGFQKKKSVPVIFEPPCTYSSILIYTIIPYIITITLYNNVIASIYNKVKNCGAIPPFPHTSSWCGA
jgi:hypothetical protein